MITASSATHIYLNDDTPATLDDLRKIVADLAGTDGSTNVDIHIGHTQHQGWNCCKCPIPVEAELTLSTPA